MTPEKNCPLCQSVHTEFFLKDKFRSYFQCNTCCLVFVPTSQRLSSEEEKSRYDLHQNIPDDPNYRKFLSRIFNPIQKLIAPKSKGLDFGSGPGPTLSLMFEEAGHIMSIYDHFFANNSSIFKEKYDFITTSEVFEHLFEPRKELDRLWDCLRPSGYLGIMTNLLTNKEEFGKWYYKNDDTHICFYSKFTFRWLAEELQAKVTFFGKDVIILQKMS